MAVGLKTFPEVPQGAGGPGLLSEAYAFRSRIATWGEVALIFGLLEAVMWTPRSLGHSLLIAALVGSALWLGIRGRTRKELGLIWSAKSASVGILSIGFLLAIAIPATALATGQPVPANPDWPRFQNLWPYVIWAIAQQFLLQSFLFIRLESLCSRRPAGSNRSLIANPPLLDPFLFFPTTSESRRRNLRALEK